MRDLGPLEFFFDYISPNAYLAWTQLPGLIRRYDLELAPRPVLFAGLLKNSGQLGPAEIPAKTRWMWRNVLRKARRHDVAIGPPASHPFNPLTALRMTLALAPRDRVRFVDTVFAATWVHGRDVANPAVVAEIADSLDHDGVDLLARAASDEFKHGLVQQTNGAYQRGVFGVPTMVAGGELFWGFDDLEFLDAFLAGNDTLRESDADAWAAVSPSAWRKEADR